jgi:hypothetical protein
MLLFHIIIASLSLVFTTYLFFVPSVTKIYVAEGLVALTLASGTYLVFAKATNLLQVCITGLVYITVVSVGLVAAHNKLGAKELN